MLELYRNYVDVFRKLIVSGWKIYKRKHSCLYMWVYPYTDVPTRFRIREAYEINNTANAAATLFGTTRTLNIHCCIYDTARG